MDLWGQIAAFLGSVKASVLLTWLLMLLVSAAAALAVPPPGEYKVITIVKGDRQMI